MRPAVLLGLVREKVRTRAHAQLGAIQPAKAAAASAVAIAEMSDFGDVHAEAQYALAQALAAADGLPAALAAAREATSLFTML